jgi:hypothetical protein
MLKSRPMNRQAPICDQCKDEKNPLTEKNGIELFNTAGGQHLKVATLHRACKDAWLKVNRQVRYVFQAVKAKED